MKELKEVYVLNVTKFNFDDPFKWFEKEFDYYPSKEEMESFLNEVDKNNPKYSSFGTELNVEKIYRVIFKK
jgi:hypothetical protein